MKNFLSIAAVLFAGYVFSGFVFDKMQPPVFTEIASVPFHDSIFSKGHSGKELSDNFEVIDEYNIDDFAKKFEEEMIELERSFNTPQKHSFKEDSEIEEIKNRLHDFVLEKPGSFFDRLSANPSDITLDLLN